MLALLLALACTCASPSSSEVAPVDPDAVGASAKLPATELPPEPPPTCFGPEGAERGLIYFHGADSEPSTPTEALNHRMMEKLARELHLRVAAPRALPPCPSSPNQVCWGGDASPETAEAGLAAVKAAREGCLGDRPYEILGFSDGGLLAQALVQRCLPHGAARLTSVATSGIWQDTDDASLSGCGALRVLIGLDNEDNLARAQAFVAHLNARGAAARLQEFHGGHELPPSPTYMALAEPLPPPETPSPSE